jgi:hypothetical protein
MSMLPQNFPTPIHEAILQALSRAEERYDVRVLLAVESGSRAWIFRKWRGHVRRVLDVNGVIH